MGARVQGWGQRGLAVALVEKIRADGLARWHGTVRSTAARNAAVSQACAVNLVQRDLRCVGASAVSCRQLQACRWMISYASAWCNPFMAAQTKCATPFCRHVQLWVCYKLRSSVIHPGANCARA